MDRWVWPWKKYFDFTKTRIMIFGCIHRCWLAFKMHLLKSMILIVSWLHYWITLAFIRLLSTEIELFRPFLLSIFIFYCINICHQSCRWSWQHGSIMGPSERSSTPSKQFSITNLFSWLLSNWWLACCWVCLWFIISNILPQNSRVLFNFVLGEISSIYFKLF